MWLKNKRRKSSKIQQLMERDAELQAERAERLKASGHVWQQSVPTKHEDTPTTARHAVSGGRMIRPRPHARPQQTQRYQQPKNARIIKN